MSNFNLLFSVSRLISRLSSSFIFLEPTRGSLPSLLIRVSTSVRISTGFGRRRAFRAKYTWVPVTYRRKHARAIETRGLVRYVPPPHPRGSP